MATRIESISTQARSAVDWRDRLSRWSDRTARFIVLMVVVLGALFMALPFIWMLLTSFKHSYEIYRVPITWLPDNIFNLDSYATVFARQPFFRYIFNSFVVSAGTVLASVVFSSMAGYAFAKYRFPGKDIIFFGVVLSVLMIPFEVVVIPLYLMYSQVHLNNTLLGIMGPDLISAFGVFLMRQFMQSVPDDYIDAARVDGMSELGIFVRIVLPLSGPALATLATVKFIWTWNEFLWPLVMTGNDAVKTVTLGVATYVGMWFTDFPVVTAAATLSVIPMVILFVLFQSTIVKGMTMTGLKG
ncbi:MAG: carbohydrate ABC transporter permease [Chloroflexi bacterium]|nr:carbohydrate ABC transporter permease [Chloroflexota bacterium]